MPQTNEIRQFLLQHIPSHPGDIATLAAEEFGVSRQAINRHLRKLTDENLVLARGKTRAREYELVVQKESLAVPLSPPPEEDRIWREWAVPHLEDLARNARDVAHYGFTEMVNNAVDHSEGDRMILTLERSAASVQLNVIDNGVGIFHKIQEAFGLEDEQHAVLELSKGKLTTDPARHTGEGIFFTSRMFENFSILSGSLFLCHLPDDSDWLLEYTTPRTGTAIQIVLDPWSGRTVKEVFDRFSDVEGGYGFDITHVPVSLAQHGEENLVSRSQAKRLLARFDRFRKVVLDFDGVDSIGQAFADEIFRVFQAEHPEVELASVNATPEVQQMIQRATGETSTEQISLI